MRNQINIHVIDTGTISILEGLFSLEATRLLDKRCFSIKCRTRAREIKTKAPFVF